MEWGTKDDIQIQLDIQSQLYPHFVALTGWKFLDLRSSKLYDLSAADLT